MISNGSRLVPTLEKVPAWAIGVCIRRETTASAELGGGQDSGCRDCSVSFGLSLLLGSYPVVAQLRAAEICGTR